MPMFDQHLAQACAPRLSRSEWGIELVVGRQRAFWFDWAMLRSLPHTVLPDISINSAKSGSKDPCWEGVLVDVVLEAIGLRPSHGFVRAYSRDGRSCRIPVRSLIGRNAMIATYCQGEPLTADCGGPARLQIFNSVGTRSLSWLSILQFVTTDRSRVREHATDQKVDRASTRLEPFLSCSSARTFHAKQIHSICGMSDALPLPGRRRDLPSTARRVRQSAERSLM
jgi:hypothetical protein